jgi:hypothetical protein
MPAPAGARRSNELWPDIRSAWTEPALLQVNPLDKLDLRPSGSAMYERLQRVPYGGSSVSSGAINGVWPPSTTRSYPVRHWGLIWPTELDELECAQAKNGVVDTAQHPDHPAVRPTCRAPGVHRRSRRLWRTAKLSVEAHRPFHGGDANSDVLYTRECDVIHRRFVLIWRGRGSRQLVYSRRMRSRALQDCSEVHPDLPMSRQPLTWDQRGCATGLSEATISGHQAFREHVAHRDGSGPGSHRPYKRDS